MEPDRFGSKFQRSDWPKDFGTIVPKSHAQLADGEASSFKNFHFRPKIDYAGSAWSGDELAAGACI